MTGSTSAVVRLVDAAVSHVGLASCCGEQHFDAHRVLAVALECRQPGSYLCLDGLSSRCREREIRLRNLSDALLDRCPVVVKRRYGPATRLRTYVYVVETCIHEQLAERVSIAEPE